MTLRNASRLLVTMAITIVVVAGRISVVNAQVTQTWPMTVTRSQLAIYHNGRNCADWYYGTYGNVWFVQIRNFYMIGSQTCDYAARPGLQQSNMPANTMRSRAYAWQGATSRAYQERINPQVANHVQAQTTYAANQNKWCLWVFALDLSEAQWVWRDSSYICPAG